MRIADDAVGAAWEVRGRFLLEGLREVAFHRRAHSAGPGADLRHVRDRASPSARRHRVAGERAAAGQHRDQANADEECDSLREDHP